jgi:hypothetical protein
MNAMCTTRITVSILLLLALFGGCADSTQQLLASPEDQARLRAIQSRRFETTDEQMVLRAVIATLQDLGFVIDDGNSTLGLVSATKLEGYALRVTVTVRRADEKNMVVRASAQYAYKAITDPETYQEFFKALSKSLFLEAHDIE